VKYADLGTGADTMDTMLLPSVGKKNWGNYWDVTVYIVGKKGIMGYISG
jgi:hypothetical protein